MQNPARTQTGVITETIRGIVDRVTYHNPDNGWSVLRVLPFNNPHQQETVIIHQTKVFAGATMEFAAALDALKAKTTVDTLSTPRILAIHGKPAKVQVGGQQEYRLTTVNQGISTRDDSIHRYGRRP